MFVKPNPDRTVRVHKDHEIVEGRIVGGEEVDILLEVIHPFTRQAMPREGMDVPEDAYWMRRLRDSDVVLAELPAPVSEVAAERAEAPAPPAPEPAAEPVIHEEAPADGTVAQVAFMLTVADKAALSTLGYSQDQISHFTPDEGKRLIADQVSATPSAPAAEPETPA